MTVHLDLVERAVVELAVVERSGFIESRHYGALVALDEAGSLAFALGDPDLAILPRSAVKPWQALACRRAGLRLSPAHTALSAGSHSGEIAHVVAVREILADGGLTERDLGCPPDWPLGRGARDDLLRSGGEPSPVLMNCSGKHAAMLATCTINGWDTATYLAPEHPLQRLVRSELEQATGEGVHTVAVDGCGAPLYGTTLRGLARAAHALVTAPAGSDERAVADAMRAEPFFVAGTGRDDTEVMRLLPGALSKGGAEAVLVLAAPSGQAVALKVIDGNDRATMLLALAALARLGVDTSAAQEMTDLPVLGGGNAVGRIGLGSGWADAPHSLHD